MCIVARPVFINGTAMSMNGDPIKANGRLICIDSRASRVASSATEPTTTGFANTFDGAGLNYRNTFYWSPLQYQWLSENYLTSGSAIASLTSADFVKARMRHWLTNAADYDAVGRTLSLERLPSADGTNAGQIIWYDYAGKSSDETEGTWPCLDLVDRECVNV